ncbi:hypothetical protein KXV85_011317, partial [Aspergillus fumigatus]
KSADWKANAPHPLKSWSAGELAKLPTYYVMDLAETMAETVAKEMPSPAEIAANRWLPDSELAVYAAEYRRNGFQGGLQWYRCGTMGAFTPELQTWSGRTIDVPSAFISGKQDWGTYQRPGVFEAMQTRVCTKMIGCHLGDGAGHWVQQEQPAEVSRLLLDFVRQAGAGSLPAVKNFSDLSEREVLAVAISAEEEDSRIYMAFAEDLAGRYPDSARLFEQMAEEERGHRHRLLEIYEQRFGPHLPPIRREDVRGFLKRRPIWLTKNLPLDTIRKEVETMELEAERFYARASELAQDVG